MNVKIAKLTHKNVLLAYHDYSNNRIDNIPTIFIHLFLRHSIYCYSNDKVKSIPSTFTKFSSLYTLFY